MTSAIPSAIEVCNRHYRSSEYTVHGCKTCPIGAECGDVRANEHRSFDDWRAIVEPAAAEVLRTESNDKGNGPERSEGPR